MSRVRDQLAHLLDHAVSVHSEQLLDDLDNLIAHEYEATTPSNAKLLNEAEASLIRSNEYDMEMGVLLALRSIAASQLVIARRADRVQP